MDGSWDRDGIEEENAVAKSTFVMDGWLGTEGTNEPLKEGIGDFEGVFDGSGEGFGESVGAIEGCLYSGGPKVEGVSDRYRLDSGLSVGLRDG